ncbi:MAG: N-acetylmuramoyl-L-alanine amidase [Methylococcales bacterium]|nr:N-acetylmuramoyl-L-alanine amidase [Methylococcales bacterium]
MHIFWKLFLLIGLQFLAFASVANQVEISAVNYSNDITHSRVVFDTSSSIVRNVFLLDAPSRLVIDFKNARLNKQLTQPPTSHPHFKRIRSGKKNAADLRVVVDLKHTVQQSNFNIAPYEKKGHRFVVDLTNASKNITLVPSINRPPTLNNYPILASKGTPKTILTKSQDIIIAIDAGHGGIDSGAKGPEGTQEKKVVFAIAQKLATLINQKIGMRAILVRKGDYYIKLRKRMEIARAAKADLFISIHADAFKNSEVRGASVFTLSRNGASSEAAHWLANHENSADLVGGVSLDDKDDILASVLLDLSQNATKEASRKVASKVLKHFKSIGKLHKHQVQKAAFAVLKSPDIPSILVETAFISNPYEERNLLSRTHQAKIANAIFNGVVSYFKEYAPANTRMAAIR